MFQTTQWTQVLAAGETQNPDSRQALAALCQSYWPPVYSYVRWRGYNRPDAEDLTQGFFARLLEKKSLRHARRERGRFRSFLLASIKHYLANEWDRARAQKRGSGEPPLALDFDVAEARYRPGPARSTTPEGAFLKQWALTLLEETLAELGAEMSRQGQEQRFEALAGYLTGDEAGVPYREVAARLDLSEAAVKVQVHRMRKRYGQLLRQKIADTVASPDQIEYEISSLLEVVGY